LREKVLIAFRSLATFSAGSEIVMDRVSMRKPKYSSEWLGSSALFSKLMVNPRRCRRSIVA